MKSVLFFLLLMLLLQTIVAQQPAKKTSSANQNMQEAMQKMQAEMDKLDPETKRMLDSLGVISDVNQQMKKSENVVKKVSDQQMKDAVAKASNLVPKRNAARIAAIPAKVNVKAFVGKIQSGIAKAIKPAIRQQADKAYDYLVAKGMDAQQSGLVAASFWVTGKVQQAAYLMGKVCLQDPSNEDNMSNYAAMLSMLGMQDAAIPLLNNLNAQFPDNSTILNNLGQAWFGLGEISKADKYLDSAIVRFPGHAQANMTKACLEQYRGNKKKAEVHIKKAIKESYTREKEQELNKLKYKLKDGDMNIPFDFKTEYDPLNLGAIRRPDYPYSVDQIRAYKPLWDDFVLQCERKIAVLEKEVDERDKMFKDSMMQTVKMTMEAYTNGNISGTLMEKGQMPLFSVKASLKLTTLLEWYNVKMKLLGEERVIVNKKMEEAFGKKKWPVPEASCEVHKKAWDAYVKQCNELLYSQQKEELKLLKQFLNEFAYWSQFTQADENMLSIIVGGLKIRWLRFLSEPSSLPLLKTGYIAVNNCPGEKEENGKSALLTEFNDVACKYNSKMDLGVMSIESNCSKLTGKFDLKFLEYTRIEDMDRKEGDTYISSTIKISAEMEVGSRSAGPLKVEAKAGAGVEIEMDKTGVKDVIIIVEGKAGAGTNIFDKGLGEHGSIAGKDIVDTTVEIGLEGRISIISGAGSVSGTGFLSDVKL